MSSISELLQPGESVTYQTGLHWGAYIKPILVFVLGVVVCCLIVSSKNPSSTLIYVGYGIMVLSLIYFILVWIVVRSSVFVVTNRRVYIKTGVFSQAVKDIRLAKADSISVETTLAGRIFGYGNLVVSSTGDSKNVYHDVSCPQKFRNAINKQIDLMGNHIDDDKDSDKDDQQDNANQ